MGGIIAMNGTGQLSGQRQIRVSDEVDSILERLLASEGQFPHTAVLPFSDSAAVRYKAELGNDIAKTLREKGYDADAGPVVENYGFRPDRRHIDPRYTVTITITGLTRTPDVGSDMVGHDTITI